MPMETHSKDSSSALLQLPWVCVVIKHNMLVPLSCKFLQRSKCAEADVFQIVVQFVFHTQHKPWTVLLYDRGERRKRGEKKKIRRREEKGEEKRKKGKEREI